MKPTDLAEATQCIISENNIRYLDESRKLWQVTLLSSRHIVEEISKSFYSCFFPKSIWEENDVALLKGTYLFKIPLGGHIFTPKYTYKSGKDIIQSNP